MATDVHPATGPALVEPSTRRERVGWYFYDFANSTFSTTVVTVFLGPYLSSIAENAAHCGGTANPCDTERLHVLGIPVAPGSVFPYVVSLSVFLQVFVLPVVGAVADRSAHKKYLLALFAYLGAGATIGLLFLTGDRYLLGVGLFLVANIAFGASVVVYNSFLPQLATPDRRDAVSTMGWAIGYIGGGVLLLINLVAITLEGTNGSMAAPRWGDATVARWSLVSAGVWWAVFTTLPLLNLRDRPAVDAGPRRGRVVTDGFRQLWQTLRHLRSYPLTLFFLVAYLVYNDGIQTVITMASVFADKELGLSKSVQLQTILLVQFLAFGGALLLGAFAKRYGGWKTVLGSLIVWVVVLAVAYTLPKGSAAAFMALGVPLGLVLGGSQALSRSLFSQLIPRGKEGEYFGLYEISDKGTSWLGPLLFGLAYQATNSYRIAILSLISFFVIGFVGLLAVPMRRAVVAAGNTPPHVL
jgi:UMF1 family MFS transporter